MEKTTKVNVIAREADIIKGKPLDYKTFVKKKKENVIVTEHRTVEKELSSGKRRDAFHIKT